MIAETCHPIDLQTFCDAQCTGHPLPARPVLVTFDDGYRSVFELARPILLRHKVPADDVHLLRAGPSPAAVLVRRGGARTRCGGGRRSSRSARRRMAQGGGGRRHAGRCRAGDRADDRRRRSGSSPTRGSRSACTPRRTRGSPDRQLACSATSSRRAAPRSSRGPDGRSIRSRIRSGAPRIRLHRRDAWRSRRASVSRPVSPPAAISPVPSEPALERSRFVVLAAVTAAELAHRIAYAWPR